MKPLRTLAVVTVGPLLLGLGFAVGAWITMPRFRDLYHLVSTLAIGAIVGLALLGPLAAIGGIAARWPERFARHSRRLRYWSSLAMRISVGYLAGCVLNLFSDGLVLIALALLFIGVTVSMGLSYVPHEQLGHNTR